MARRIVRSRKVIIQNTWKCSSCGQENAGTLMTCGDCAHPKDASESYRPPPDIQRAPEVTDQARLKEAAAGPNWTCDYCQGQVRNLHGECQACAGAKPVAEPVVRQPRPTTTYQDPPRTIFFIVGAIVIPVAILMTVLLVTCRSKPQKTRATVVEMSWHREVRLEHRTVVLGKGWRDNAPPGTYGFACNTEKRGTRNCNPYDCNPRKVKYDCDPYQCNPEKVEYDCDPYDCNCTTERGSCTDLGNGYSECDEVESCDTCYKTCTKTEYDTCYKTCTKTEYDTCYEQCDVFGEMCTYHTDAWHVIDRDGLTGSGPDARWPQRLTAAGVDQRLQTSETYFVRFAERVEKNPRAWNHAPATYDAYRQFTPGQLWEIRPGSKGEAKPLKIITAEKEP